MILPPVIGLSGVARSGKDTVGQILHDLFEYDVMSFSTALNDALIALNPLVEDGHGTLFRYEQVITHLGYEGAKEIPEVRRLLQAFGTEVGRDFFGENVWVDALFRRVHPGSPPVITNVRFPNEFEAVRERGGVVWRVERPGFTAANGHVSDTALDDHEFDAWILNDGTIGDLAQSVIDKVEHSSVNWAHNTGVRA